MNIQKYKSVQSVQPTVTDRSCNIAIKIKGMLALCDYLNDYLNTYTQYLSEYLWCYLNGPIAIADIA
jgi:hypothetical protein